MKGLALLFAALLAAQLAHSQSTAALTSVPPLHRAAYIPPVEAEAVNEPLQRRSINFQRLCRAQLLSKLNRIFETHDTSRGLVITVPDSLLSPETSKKLAQIAEMLPPDVTVRVEGYTDHRGSNAENEANSYRRAQAVQSVLSANDTIPRSIAVAGFVSSTPFAGRPNRRVEIVISGPGIGQTAASRHRI